MTSTYCDGYDLTVMKDVITKKDIIDLCHVLKYTFNQRVGIETEIQKPECEWVNDDPNDPENKMENPESFRFRPEPIIEGGIIWDYWPGKEDGMYKTMRIRFNDAPGANWPIVTDNVMEEWADSSDVIIRQRETDSESQKEPVRLRTVLKAFNGAPGWIIEELRLFEHSLYRFGLYRSGRYPSDDELVHQRHMFIIGDDDNVIATIPMDQ